MITKLLMLQSASTSPEIDAATQTGLMVGGTFYLVILVLMIVACWKLFTKAGQPGWAALIPFYNVIVLLQIVGRPLWWIILLFIPFVNFIIGLILALDLAKSFGKGGGFGVGLIFLGFIFLPILAFGDSKYVGRPS